MRKWLFHPLYTGLWMLVAFSSQRLVAQMDFAVIGDAGALTSASKQVQNHEFLCEYLNSAIEENDLEYLKIALGDIAKALDLPKDPGFKSMQERRHSDDLNPILRG